MPAVSLLQQRVGRHSPSRRSMPAGHSPLAAHLARAEPSRRWSDPASSRERSRLPWHSPSRRSMPARHSPLAAHLARTEPSRRWSDPASSRERFRLPWHWPSDRVSASERVLQRFPRSAPQRVVELVLKTPCCLRHSSWRILSEPGLVKYCFRRKKQQCLWLSL